MESDKLSGTLIGLTAKILRLEATIMDKYRKIMSAVMGQQQQERRKEIRRISEIMCLSVDESPPMVALLDGAASLAALYDLCSIYGIDTTYEYAELKERMEYLMMIMQEELKERFPAPAQRRKVGGNDI